MTRGSLPLPGFKACQQAHQSVNIRKRMFTIVRGMKFTQPYRSLCCYRKLGPRSLKLAALPFGVTRQILKKPPVHSIAMDRRQHILKVQQQPQLKTRYPMRQQRGLPRLGLLITSHLKGPGQVRQKTVRHHNAQPDTRVPALPSCAG